MLHFNEEFFKLGRAKVGSARPSGSKDRVCHSLDKWPVGEQAHCIYLIETEVMPTNLLQLRWAVI